ncbi:MAG TPA: hypothetical protein VMW53_07465 [archaeon]|nr:hypothetical protein [archaeon]
MSEKTFPIKNTIYSFVISLTDQTNALVFKSAPTLAAGDVKVSTDGGALGNITVLPIAVGKIVTVILSAAEMNGDSVVVIFSDAAGDEWCDLITELRPAAVTIGDLPTAAEVWASAVRTLTISAVPSFAATAGVLYMSISSTFSASITGLGSLANISKLYFTAKRKVADEDADAIIQIEETGGLLILNGAVAGTPANGSLTVDDAVAGDITIVLSEEETIKLLKENLFYDIKIIRTIGTTASVLQIGILVVTEDVTDAIT